MAITKTLNDELRAQPDYLALAQAVPDSTNADGNRGPGLIANVQNALEVIVEADSAINVTGTVTLSLLEADTETGSYTAIPGASIVLTNPNVAAGAELARFAIPRGNGSWVKINIACNATPTAAGGVNAFPSYVAR